MTQEMVIITLNWANSRRSWSSNWFPKLVSEISVEAELGRSVCSLRNWLKKLLVKLGFLCWELERLEEFVRYYPSLQEGKQFKSVSMGKTKTG